MQYNPCGTAGVFSGTLSFIFNHIECFLCTWKPRPACKGGFEGINGDCWISSWHPLYLGRVPPFRKLCGRLHG